jgi:SAM-dependent methyltransferase
VRSRLLPWALEGVNLGASCLEIGPGPGAVTDVLCRQVNSLTCVERDPRLADALGRRVAGRNVLVTNGDATAMTFAGRAFDSVVCMTMLHHVPSAALQDRLFREVARVLKPGGIFTGVDSLATLPLRMIHLFDTFVPLGPHTLRGRLERAGFEDVRVDVESRRLRFQATRRSNGKCEDLPASAVNSRADDDDPQEDGPI